MCQPKERTSCNANCSGKSKYAVARRHDFEYISIDPSMRMYDFSGSRIGKSIQQAWYVFGQIERTGKRELIGSSTFMVTLTKPQVVFDKNELTFRIDVCPDGDKVQRTGSTRAIPISARSNQI